MSSNTDRLVPGRELSRGGDQKMVEQRSLRCPCFAGGVKCGYKTQELPEEAAWILLQLHIKHFHREVWRRIKSKENIPWEE